MEINDESIPQTIPAEEPAALPSPKPHKLNLLPFVFVIFVSLFVVWLASLRLFATRLTTTTSNTPTINKIKQAGKIVIGTDPTFAPMEFFNSDKQYAGYDIDLGNRIAEKLGVKAEFKTIVFDNFADELNKGNVDIVLSSVTITDERKKNVLFSDPYLNAGQVIITRKDTTSIVSTKDLQGKKIAVQKGTTNEEQAHVFTAQNLVLPFDNFEEATGALLSGSADAIFSDVTGAKGIVSANPSLKVASDPFTNEQYGIVAKKGNDDLILELNNVLNGLRQQGILTFLKQQWLD